MAFIVNHAAVDAAQAAMSVAVHMQRQRGLVSLVADFLFLVPLRPQFSCGDAIKLPHLETQTLHLGHVAGDLDLAELRHDPRAVH